MKFTVHRNNWLRGYGVNSSLLDRNGDRCCLGFLAQACGYQDSELRDKACLEDLSSLDRFVKLPPGLITEESSDYFRDSDIAKKLMEINDTGMLPETVREQQLTKTFNSLNIEVEFVDG